jgi:hypothetical protein
MMDASMTVRWMNLDGALHIASDECPSCGPSIADDRSRCPDCGTRKHLQPFQDHIAEVCEGCDSGEWETGPMPEHNEGSILLPSERRTSATRLITVRVSDLKAGHQILVKGTFARVRAVEPGPHKDALTVRLRGTEPLQVSWDATVKLLVEPPVDPRQLERRRAEFVRRCSEKARDYMHATYGRVDFAVPEWRDRLAVAAQGAARELARLGELKGIGIERPAQVSKVKCEVVTSTSDMHLDAWGGAPAAGTSTNIHFDFTETDLESLPPPPPAVNDA